MSESRLKDQVTHHKALNKQARGASAVWKEIETLLIHARDASGRLKVAGNKVTVTSLRPVNPSGHTATLILDATVASRGTLVRALFGDTSRPCRVTLTDISIQWPDCVHAPQVLGATVAKNKLGLVEIVGSKPDNEGDVLRYIKMRAAQAAPAQVGVISYKQFIENIGDRLPTNVIKLHFGALSGRNDMERVAGLIVIGQNTPKPADVEHAAAVLTGVPVATVADYRFPKKPAGIALVDGGVIETEVPWHPDPIVEELRWQATGGNPFRLPAGCARSGAMPGAGFTS
jgi:hypothetical protein